MKKRRAYHIGIILLVIATIFFRTAWKLNALSDAPDSASVTQGEVGEVLVTRVVDGDTIEITGGEKVRYIGIDTPETVKPNTPIQCFGEEASNENRTLVEGKYVRLKKDLEDRDKYGRLLRYVYLNEVLINEKLVREGYAHVYTFPPNVAHVEEFRASEKYARENLLGLWGDKCNGNTKIPDPQYNQ